MRTRAITHHCTECGAELVRSGSPDGYCEEHPKAPVASVPTEDLYGLYCFTSAIRAIHDGRFNSARSYLEALS